MSGRVVVPGSAGVPPAQDLAGSWRLASQGWSVHLPTGAGAAPLQECGRDARAPRGKPMASQEQIPLEGVILQEHSAPISCPTPNFAKGSNLCSFVSIGGSRLVSVRAGRFAPGGENPGRRSNRWNLKATPAAGTGSQESARSRCSTLVVKPFRFSIPLIWLATVTDRCRPPVQPNAIVR